MYAVTGPAGRVAQPFSRVVDQPAPLQFVEQIAMRNAIYYISRW